MAPGFARAVIAAAALLWAPAAFADGPGTPEPDIAAPPVRAAPIAPAPQAAAPPTATGQTGQVSLLNGQVVLNVPQGYVFYGPPEARAYAQRASQPLPNGEVLGLVARQGAPLDSADTWATIVSYDAIGYVPPENIETLSAESFEADVREARTTQGRRFEGFALSPGFEATAGNMSWAERVASPGSTGRDLRHEQRLLSRGGVAGLTSIGSADQMPDMTAAAPTLLSMIGFGPGQSYGNYTQGDRVSNFDVPGLVTNVPKPAIPAPEASKEDTPAGGLQGMFPWIALGVAGLAGAGFLLFRRRGRDANIGPE